MQSPEYNISDSENEKEEKYLKIFYEGSLKFIEIPLDEDSGALLYSDVKAMEPNIFALSLVKGDKFRRLYKPKNGCFKEPKEKWNNFKIFAVLNDSINDLGASSLTNDYSAVKASGELCLSFASHVKAIKQEALSSPHHNIVPPPSTSVQSLNTSLNMVESMPSDTTVTDLCHQILQKPRSIQIKKEACDSSLKSDVQALQSTSSYSFADTVTKEIKKEILPNFLDISPSTSKIAALKKKCEGPYAFFTNVFDSSKRKIRMFNGLKRVLAYRVAAAKLKLPFDDPLLLEKLTFLKKNVIRHPSLKDIFTENFFCSNCKKRKFDQIHKFVKHVAGQKHLRFSLTQDELNKLIQAVAVIDYSADNGLFYTSTLPKKTKQICRSQRSFKRQRKT